MENKTKFKVGQVYRGTSGVGHIDLTVVKRTAKSIVVKSCLGENRVMVKNFSNVEETGTFRSWFFGANDIYSTEQMKKDAYDAAYHS